MDSSTRPSFTQKRLLLFLESVLIFVVFAAHAGWAVPDSNEAHYIGKAIHYWNSDWIPNDPFLDSKDTHICFYITFGWTSLFLSPVAMAWVGRVLSWSLMAWSWGRLSRALIPVPWISVLSSAGLVYFIQSFHMAGEWVVGGIEGKSLAFPFIFFGLEAMLRNRWNRAWIFFGIASAFHVLLGGWSVVCAGICWFLLARIDRPKLFSMLPGLLIGGLCSLPGLWPALSLDIGASSESADMAHQIYVFQRLAHHLDPTSFSVAFLSRFTLLVLIWGFLCRANRTDASVRFRVLNRFILGTLLLAFLGLFFGFGLKGNPSLSASLLRFYWFRMSDFAVPMGVALGGSACLVHYVREAFSLYRERSAFSPLGFLPFFVALSFGIYWFAYHYLGGYWTYFEWGEFDPVIPWGVAVIISGLATTICLRAKNVDRKLFFAVAAVVLYSLIAVQGPVRHFVDYAIYRTVPVYSRIDPPHGTKYWIEACRWVSESDIPKDARFLTPRDAATFTWHSKRPNAGNWKDIPQDAESIVKWHETMYELFASETPDGEIDWNVPIQSILSERTPEEIEALREKYRFDYIISHRFPKLKYRIVYENEWFVIYDCTNRE